MNITSQTVKLTSYGVKTYLFFAAIIALFITLSELLDYFELPFESLAIHLVTSTSLISGEFVTSSVTTFGYVGVFILMLLESASLPIPSEVVLPFAGYLVFNGSMNFAVVVLVSTVAGVLGAMADYFLALKLGRPLVERAFRWTGGRPEHLNRMEKWLSTKGSWIILVARFVPGMRSAISLPAGALGMRLRTFAATTLIGSFGWSILLTYLGYSAGSLWQTVLVSPLPLVIEVALLTIALASISYVAYFVALKMRPART